MASGWTDYWQKSTYTMKHNDLTDIGESDHHVRYSDDEALSVFQANLEAAPTNIATKAPTSSWAYTHENDVDAHHAKYTDGEALSVFQANLEAAPTNIATKAPTSSWAYDHENDASAHHAKYTDGEALSVFQANLEANPTNGETGKAANSNWSYDHAANASAHHAKYTDGEALSVFQANLEANPTNGETGKAANSNWSYDHAANASAHHTKYTNAEAVSAVSTADNYIKNTGDSATGDYNFCGSLLVLDDTDNQVRMVGDPELPILNAAGTGYFQKGLLVANTLSGTSVTQNEVFDDFDTYVNKQLGTYHCHGCIYASGAIIIVNRVTKTSSDTIRFWGFDLVGSASHYDCVNGSSTTIDVMSVVM